MDRYIYEKKGDRLLQVSPNPKDCGSNHSLRLFWSYEAKDCTLEYYLEEGSGLIFNYVIIAVHPNGSEGKYKLAPIFWSKDLDDHEALGPQPIFGHITIVD